MVITFRDSINMRRFPTGCDYYRENWTVDDGETLYQIYCLRGTPPLTREEQEKCIASKRGCWRRSAAQKRGANAAATAS
ncbi:MAG: hypothetical protein M1401_08410 [Chloroflexi bacterium]|nr:hypothetical protein [Chloroflexota bacterium]MCL5108869.1 hypothetical protein [Chloroflexota bacterium]